MLRNWKKVILLLRNPVAKAQTPTDFISGQFLIEALNASKFNAVGGSHEDEVPQKPYSAKRHRGTVSKNGMSIKLLRAYPNSVFSARPGCFEKITKSDATKSRYFVPLVVFTNPCS